MSRRLERAVAAEATRFLDEHRIGVCIRPSDDSPLRDAIASVRKTFEDCYDDPLDAVDFDCEVKMYVANGFALASFDHGNDDYLKLFRTRDGVRPYDWRPDAPRPAEVDVKDWREREAAWREALFSEDGKTARLGAGLLFHLVDGRLPAPKWPQVRKAAPAAETRLRRAARLIAWAGKSGTATPPDARQASEFRKWLGTRDGVAAYDEARRRALAAIPTQIGREELARYGDKTAVRKRSVAAKADAPKPIDHADIYEATDGRVFVVVWDAGFDEHERIHVQINGDQASFVQSGLDFGTLQKIPSAALDLLRGARDATVVEVRNFGDRKEVKAKHVAMVRNTSLSDGIGAAMTRWRSNAATPAKEDTWAEQ
jgi:hypothetical protein